MIERVREMFASAPADFPTTARRTGAVFVPLPSNVYGTPRTSQQKKAQTSLVLVQSGGHSHLFIFKLCFAVPVLIPRPKLFELRFFKADQTRGIIVDFIFSREDDNASRPRGAL